MSKKETAGAVTPAKDKKIVNESKPSIKRRMWVKFWRRTPYNRTLRRAPIATRWLWAVLLTLPESIDGRLIGDGSSFTTEDIADAAALPLEDVTRGLNLLLSANMLRLDPDGCVQIVNFTTHQETAAASRMRGMRLRNSSRTVTREVTEPFADSCAGSYGTVRDLFTTDGDGDEDLKHCAKTSPWTKENSVSASTVDGGACSSKSKPKRRNQKAVRAWAEAAGFSKFWDQWPNKKSKIDAELAFAFDLGDEERRLLPDRTADYLTRRQATKATGDEFVPNLPLPATFIRGRRWEDSFEPPEKCEIERELEEVRREEQAAK